MPRSVGDSADEIIDVRSSTPASLAILACGAVAMAGWAVRRRR
jgi:uncharacterized protein (TIGR03382 family)